MSLLFHRTAATADLKVLEHAERSSYSYTCNHGYRLLAFKVRQVKVRQLKVRQLKVRQLKVRQFKVRQFKVRQFKPTWRRRLVWSRTRGTSYQSGLVWRIFSHYDERSQDMKTLIFLQLGVSCLSVSVCRCLCVLHNVCVYLCALTDSEDCLWSSSKAT